MDALFDRRGHTDEWYQQRCIFCADCKSTINSHYQKRGSRCQVGQEVGAQGLGGEAAGWGQQVASRRTQQSRVLSVLCTLLARIMS